MKNRHVQLFEAFIAEDTKSSTSPDATPEAIADFIRKNEKHYAAFLRPKSFTVDVDSNVITIRPKSNKFTIIVDFGKRTITTKGKPEYPESTSHAELEGFLYRSLKFKTQGSSIEEAVQLEAKAKIKDYADVKVGDIAFENPDTGGEWNNRLGEIIWKGTYDELLKSKYKRTLTDWDEEDADPNDYDLIVVDVEEGMPKGAYLYNYNNDPSGAVVFK